MGISYFSYTQKKLETDDMEQIIRNRQRIFKINKDKDLNITINEINISLLQQSYFNKYMDITKFYWSFHKINMNFRMFK